MAFFDFQYVGFGCGLSDVAKLFTCSVERDLLLFDDEEEEGEDEEERMGMAMGMGKGEERLLKHYQHILENVSGKKYSWEVLVMHWYVFFHFIFFFSLSFFFRVQQPYFSLDIHDKIRQIGYMYQVSFVYCN